MKTFTIYTKDGCGYCSRAKDLIKSKGYKYNEFTVGAHCSKADLQKKVDTLVEGVVVSTVPQIFLVNDGQPDTYIGGYDQLASKINNL